VRRSPPTGKAKTVFHSSRAFNVTLRIRRLRDCVIAISSGRWPPLNDSFSPGDIAQGFDYFGKVNGVTHDRWRTGEL